MRYLLIPVLLLPFPAIADWSDVASGPGTMKCYIDKESHVALPNKHHLVWFKTDSDHSSELRLLEFNCIGQFHTLKNGSGEPVKTDWAYIMPHTAHHAIENFLCKNIPLSHSTASTNNVYLQCQ